MPKYYDKWRQFLNEEEPFQRRMRKDLPGEIDFLLNRGGNKHPGAPRMSGATIPSGKSAPPLGEGARLLREISEDEVEHIRDAIDEMGPEELAFNDAFQGRTRRVIDFPAIDIDSDLGKFMEFFRKQEYEVDWKRGIVSAE